MRLSLPSVPISTILFFTLVLVQMMSIVPNADSHRQATGHSRSQPFTIDRRVSPVVKNLSPTSGPAKGGTIVTLTGNHFYSGLTQVEINGLASQSVRIISKTELRITMPKNEVGWASLLIMNPGGASLQLPNAFKYFSALLPVEPIPSDVNQDQVIDILDLVLVASQFGREGNALVGDVDGDGRVSIFDLVMVANQFGQNPLAQLPAVAPSQLEQMETELSADQRLRAIKAIDELAADSSQSAEILAFLQRVSLTLRPRAIPSMTQLLPNYPNPFNPETWIPFRLASNTGVRLLIYSASGQLVRQLVLGSLPAGDYLTPDRSAYWDGRDQKGRIVPSGIYFCRLDVIPLKMPSTVNGRLYRQLTLLK